MGHKSSCRLLFMYMKLAFNLGGSNGTTEVQWMRVVEQQELDSSYCKHLYVHKLRV